MGRALCIVAPLSGLFGPVTGSKEDCSSCYQVDMGAMIGIIACDIMLTLLIAFSVYCFVSRQKRRPSLQTHAKACETGKGKIHTSSKRAKKVEMTESPYQELYGVQSDVYSDLRQYRK